MDFKNPMMENKKGRKGKIYLTKNYKQRTMGVKHPETKNKPPARSAGGRRRYLEDSLLFLMENDSSRIFFLSGTQVNQSRNASVCPSGWLCA
jgi:hypothetical protein